MQPLSLERIIAMTYGDKKCLPVLAGLYFITLLVSQLLSYRFVTFGSILTVASVFIIPFTYSIADLIAEQYGYHTIRKTIWWAMMMLFITCFALCTSQALPAAAKYQKYTDAYYVVFHPMLRIYFANLIAAIPGMFLNSYIIVKWKIRVQGKIFFVRSLVSSLAGEMLFTSIAISLVQFGIVKWQEIAEMILISMSVKIIFTVFSAGVARMLKPMIRRIDGGDTFENTTNYNPFAPSLVK